MLDTAKSRGIKRFILEKERVNRDTVQSFLRKHSPDTVIFNGHGNQLEVVGNDEKPIISVNDNLNLLENKVVFVRACSAGEVMGPKAINIGARGFIGYKESFVFLYDQEKIQKPLDDGLARPFFECSNQIGISLIKGQSAREAHNSSINLYQKKISRMLSSKADSFSIPYLLWNMIHQVCLE